MKILVAGDFCPRLRVVDLFEKGSFESVLGEVKKEIDNADYSIVNFECPVTRGEEKPIEKFGPNLQCSKKGIEALKWAGFDCVTLANNHFFDYGNEGVRHTLDVCQQYGIDTVGGGISLKEASRILYKRIEGKTLAIINCCEHEFSIATESTAGSNPLNPIQQYYKIQEAKGHADKVLVIVHGGHEQYSLPSPRMKENYRFFVDIGADAVINHHQHCYSGYEVYNGKPIFYGLGNFCFDNDKSSPQGWNEGYLVMLIFTNDKVSFEIIPYEQCLDEVGVKILDKDAFFQEIELLNKIISDDNMLNAHITRYFNESMKTVSYTIEPIQNRYIAALQHRNLLPSLWSQSWMVKLQNFVICESHRDKLEYFLKNFYSK